MREWSTHHWQVTKCDMSLEKKCDIRVRFSVHANFFVLYKYNIILFTIYYKYTTPTCLSPLPIH